MYFRKTLTALVALAGASGPAGAAIVNFTGSGVVTSATDLSAIGTAVSVKWAYDTDTAPSSSVSDLGVPIQYYFNDSAFTSPVTFENSIFGTTVLDFSSSVSASSQGLNTTDYTFFGQRADGASGTFVFTENQSLSAILPSSYSTVNQAGGSVLFANSVASYAYNLTSITSAFAATVPEPATWGMMLTGFGLAGAAMRRRRAIPTHA